MSKHVRRFATLAILLTVACLMKAQDVTALWDFRNANPSTITSVNIQSKAEDVVSSISTISMHVNATNNGKLAYNSQGYAQFNAGTIIQVPVKSTMDSVYVVSYPGQYAYTVGGVAATQNETGHKVSTAEKTQGYVEIIATKTAYLYSITVIQKSMIQEKQLFSSNFKDWTSMSASKAETSVDVSTKYSHESLSIKLFDCDVNPKGSNAKFQNGQILGWIMAAKSDDPYIITSSLASITKVHFIEGATGSNRGYKLWAKGDGDADWVLISDAIANPSAWCELTKDINRTNCQLKFTNITNNQNAYLFQLDIYGNVDMSATPALGSFLANGTKYNAADIFAEQADGTLTATIEVSKKDKMISENNQLTSIVADNGDITSTTYTTTNDTTTATIVISASAKSATYKTIFVFKPDFTVTYYNTDGVSLGTQTVEKDATIESFKYNESNVTTASGKKFRGWFMKSDGGEKLTTAKIVTANMSIYALATDIETESASARYYYNLTDPYFYSEDHEAFVLKGTGKFHDNTHGWVFNANDSLKLMVGGDAYIILGLCRYGDPGTIKVVNEAGDSINTLTFPVTNDGQSRAIKYSGKAGVLTFVFSVGAYVHNITIDNMADNPITKNGQGYYIVNKGDIKSLYTTLDVVNATNSVANAERAYIFIPDGTYDMGKTALTPITGSNISIIGQSMDKTIIVNAPDLVNEGIGTTATFLVTGSNVYFQDLTLKNALDYYKSGSAGRAVCLQDKGNHTICKNVRMLSYQDTYYSNNNSAQLYWETSDIHGTVDFICGGGDVFFNKCTLTVEKRNADGTGSCTLTAPYTDTTNYGYVFDGCTIVNYAAEYNFGRAWGGKPRCAYLNTTLNDPDKLASSRWTTAGMNTYADKFVEYNTLNASGTVISPASNILTFSKDSKSSKYETILTADQAKSYALDSVFQTWKPAELATQLTMSTVTLKNNILEWQTVADAKAYIITQNGKFVAMVDGVTTSYTTDGNATSYEVRAANTMGGFGTAVSSVTTGITDANGNVVNNVTYYNAQGMKLSQPVRGLNIKIEKNENGGTKSSKIMVD